VKCLLVVAHPLSESLCAHLAREARQALEAAGHEVTVEELYGSGFNAALSTAERGSYYSGPYDAQGVHAETRRLLEAEALVLVFPTWWFSFPAILKGWFDRVWAPGIAYDHADDLGPIRARLHGLRHVLAVTTLGSPWWVDCLVLRQPVKRVLKTALVGTCAPRAGFRMISLYQAERVDAERVGRFARRMRDILRRWDEVRPADL
jgi:putative NADPH-quinone reductase